MDKDLLVAEFLKIYFSAHPDKIPKDSDKAFELFHKLHKRYKTRYITDFKQKSEKFVNKFFDDDEPTYR